MIARHFGVYRELLRKTEAQVRSSEELEVKLLKEPQIRVEFIIIDHAEKPPALEAVLALAEVTAVQRDEARP